ncbi:unnamed protein product [Pleuronectes platessa]|uniref:Uncharacterized protein n=1 Tax=Pleuronectes platessa TaxID=8262 RepID=A0A9N7ZCG7_PLEPL|nr:unnamed protein product [Pleuronectes platessa]
MSPSGELDKVSHLPPPTTTTNPTLCCSQCPPVGNAPAAVNHHRQITAWGDPEQKCVKLKYVLSYSPPEQATEGREGYGKGEGEKQGGRAEDANPNAVPEL